MSNKVYIPFIITIVIIRKFFKSDNYKYKIDLKKNSYNTNKLKGKDCVYKRNFRFSKFNIL